MQQISPLPILAAFAVKRSFGFVAYSGMGKLFNTSEWCDGEIKSVKKNKNGLMLCHKKR